VTLVALVHPSAIEGQDMTAVAGSAAAERSVR